MDTIIFLALFIAFIIGIRIWSSKKIKQTQAKVAGCLAQGEQAEAAGRRDEAAGHYSEALMAVLGLGPENTEWTAKGLCGRMDQDGRQVVEKLKAALDGADPPIDWAAFDQLIDDFRQFSTDKKLVNRYGLPKTAGKSVYAGMRQKLVEFTNTLAANPRPPAMLNPER